MGKKATKAADNMYCIARYEAAENNEVTVDIFRKKDDTIKDRFHSRVFSPKTTRVTYMAKLM